MRWLVLALFASVALAGCADDALIQGSGTQRGQEHRTVSCADGTGKVSVEIDGTGSVDVLVTDGAAQVQYTKSFDGVGSTRESQSLEGTPGKWTVTATFAGSDGGPGSFVGEWAIDLDCA